jgi:hypothetical protein
MVPRAVPLPPFQGKVCDVPPVRTARVARSIIDFLDLLERPLDCAQFEPVDLES